MTAWQVRRFFINSVWRQRSRAGIAFVMIAVSIMFSLILTSITVGIDQTVRSILGVQYALDTIRASPSANSEPLRASVLESIRALPSVASVEPYFTFLSRATLGTNRAQLNLISIPATAPEVQRLELRSGRSLRSDDQAAVVLSERAIRAMGILDPDTALEQPLTIMLRRGSPPPDQEMSQQTTQTEKNRVPTSNAAIKPSPTSLQSSALPSTDLASATVDAQLAPSSAAASTTQPLLDTTDLGVTTTAEVAGSLDEFTHVYTATVVGIAKQTVSDRGYLSPDIGLQMASWQAYMQTPELIEHSGYNGVQVVARRVEDVRSIQRELAALQLSTEAALDSANQAQTIVERVQFGLVGLLALTLILALLLTYGLIWTTIRSSAPQIGTLLLVGAPPDQVRAVLTSIALAIVVPGAIAGLTLGWLLIVFVNYVWQSRTPDPSVVVLVLPVWMPLVAVTIALGLGWLAALLVSHRLRHRTIAQLLWHKDV